MRRRNPSRNLFLILALFLASCCATEIITDVETGEQRELTCKESRKKKGFLKYDAKGKRKYPDQYGKNYGSIDTTFRIEGKSAPFLLRDINHGLKLRDTTISQNGIKIIRLPGDTVLVECPDEEKGVQIEYECDTQYIPEYIEKDYTWWQKMFFYLGIVAAIVLILKIVFKWTN